jgi:hypothetical protein
MRLLQTLDKLSFEHRKLDQALEVLCEIEDANEPCVDPDPDLPPITDRICIEGRRLYREELAKKKAAQALAPPSTTPPAEPEEERFWPITARMREALIAHALELGGITVSPDGQASISVELASEPSIALAALGVLTRFDQLAMARKRALFLGKPARSKEQKRPDFEVDPEIDAMLGKFIHDERVKLRDNPRPDEREEDRWPSPDLDHDVDS